MQQSNSQHFLLHDQLETLSVQHGTYTALLSWPWSSAQPSREDRVPEQYIPDLRVQEAWVDGTQTLRRSGSFETNP